MKKLLTIAGSDCIGGAGIQADLKTFAAHSCYGMSVVTAVTAQNTNGVITSADVPPEIVAAQLDAVFDDVFPDGVKIGMISSAGTAEILADKLFRRKPEIIVADPVMVSTSGYRMLSSEAERVLITKLMPLVTLVTPNIPEAEILSGTRITSHNDMETAAQRIISMGADAVLIKGGHLTDSADDLLFNGTDMLWLKAERIASGEVHGTGCALSSAICAQLANGLSLPAAVNAAKKYTAAAIKHSAKLGGGSKLIV